VRLICSLFTEKKNALRVSLERTVRCLIFGPEVDECEGQRESAEIGFLGIGRLAGIVKSANMRKTQRLLRVSGTLESAGHHCRELLRIEVL
jgi:hypothetical protein